MGRGEDVEQGRRRCRFWRHQWSDWEKISLGSDRLYLPIVLQERRCRACGRYQRKAL